MLTYQDYLNIKYLDNNTYVDIEPELKYLKNTDVNWTIDMVAFLRSQHDPKTTINGLILLLKAGTTTRSLADYILHLIFSDEVEIKDLAVQLVENFPPLEKHELIRKVLSSEAKLPKHINEYAQDILQNSIEEIAIENSIS